MPVLYRRRPGNRYTVHYTSAQPIRGRGGSLSRPALRICIASGTFHPDSGGPPTYLAALCRALIAGGHRVQVVTYGDARERRCYPYPVTRIARDRAVPSRLALFVRAIVQHGRSADLLFVNDYGLPAMLANVGLRKPLVMKIVGDFAWEYAVRHGWVAPDEPLERCQARRYSPRVELLKRMQAAYARRADRVIAPSAYVGRYVERWGVPGERVRVVPNAVAEPAASQERDRSDARRCLDLPSDANVVLTVARLTPWKGVDTLIEAIDQLRRQLPTAMLVVVGDGPDRPCLEALAARHPAGLVRFVGEVSHATVTDYLIAADVLALCSGYEGLSHVLLEGMAAGLPVVASAVGGNLELVRHKQNGLLVPYADVAATAEALYRLLTDPALAGRLAGCARQEAGERTVERMVEQTFDVFYEAVDSRAAQPRRRSCASC